MTIISGLSQQACDLYVARASGTLTEEKSNEAVSMFIRTMDLLPGGSPGEHVTVWSVFLVALESSNTKHRQYLVKVLRRHYDRNGFANILTALKFLQQIWSQPRSLNWTDSLTDFPVFVV